MKEDIASAAKPDLPEPEILTKTLPQLQITETSKTKKKEGRKQKVYVPGGRVVACDYVCPNTGVPRTNVYKDYFKDPPNCEIIVTAQRNYQRLNCDQQLSLNFKKLFFFGRLPRDVDTLPPRTVFLSFNTS